MILKIIKNTALFISVKKAFSIIITKCRISSNLYYYVDSINSILTDQLSLIISQKFFLTHRAGYIQINHRIYTDKYYRAVKDVSTKNITLVYSLWK